MGNMCVEYTSDKYYIGATFNSNNYGLFKIIGKSNERKNYYYIKFIGYNEVYSCRSNHIKKGAVKNCFLPTIYGVGYFGAVKSHTYKSYKTWSSMLGRCYSEKEIERYPSYTEVYVCEEWLNFSNYNKWFILNYKSGFCLDKDILIKGNKIYSPETCCFVPQRINLLFLKSDFIRGEYPIGVHKSNNKYVASCNTGKKVQEYLGKYKTPIEAFNIYKECKEKYLNELSEKYKNVITNKVYMAIKNYKVEITD